MSSPDEILDSLMSLRSRNVKILLTNFFEIYTRPIKVYRTVLYKNKKGYNLVLYLVLYYTLFGLVVMNIPIPEVFIPVIIDVSFLIVPFTVFALPFWFFTKLNSIDIPLSRLFSLMLVLKLQFGMLYTLSWYVGLVTEREFPYFLAMNILGLILLAYFIIPPALTRVSIVVKLIWVTVNFIFYNVVLMAHLMLSECIPSYADVAGIYEEYSVFEPSNPRNEFDEIMFSPLIIEEVLFDVYMFKVGFDSLDRKRMSFCFVTETLDSAYSITYRNQTHSTNDVGGLTLAGLDSTQTSISNVWNDDRRIFTHFRDSGRFESNVDFCKLALSYIDAYESAHFSLDSIEMYKNQNHQVQRIHFGEGKDTISIIRISHVSHTQEDRFMSLLNEVILLGDRSIFGDFFHTLAVLPTNVYLYFKEED